MPGYNPFQGLTHGGNSGLTVADYYRTAQARLAQALLDPTSQLYQGARQFAGQVYGRQGTNSFLSALQAGGGNFGASQVQAQQLSQGADRQRTDFLNQFMQGLFQQNFGQAAGVIGQAQGSDLQQQQIAVQNKQVDNQMGGWLDFLGTIAGGLAGGLTGGLFGGGGASGATYKGQGVGTGSYGNY